MSINNISLKNSTQYQEPPGPHEPPSNIPWVFLGSSLHPPPWVLACDDVTDHMFYHDVINRPMAGSSWLVASRITVRAGPQTGIQLFSRLHKRLLIRGDSWGGDSWARGHHHTEGELLFNPILHNNIGDNPHLAIIYINYLLIIWYLKQSHKDSLCCQKLINLIFNEYK